MLETGIRKTCPVRDSKQVLLFRLSLEKHDVVNSVQGVCSDMAQPYTHSHVV